MKVGCMNVCTQLHVDVPGNIGKGKDDVVTGYVVEHVYHIGHVKAYVQRLPWWREITARLSGCVAQTTSKYRPIDSPIRLVCHRVHGVPSRRPRSQAPCPLLCGLRGWAPARLCDSRLARFECDLGGLENIK